MPTFYIFPTLVVSIFTLCPFFTAPLFFNGLTFLLRGFDDDEAFNLMEALCCVGANAIVWDEPGLTVDYILVPLVGSDAVDLAGVQAKAIISPLYLEGECAQFVRPFSFQL